MATTADKRRLLLKRMMAKEGLAADVGKLATERIPRHGQDGPVALSFGQERLWLLDQLDPGSPSFNIPIALQVEGTPDLRILERSLDEVVCRHEALRTCFLVTDGQPRQQAEPHRQRRLPLADLSGLPPVAEAAELARLVEADAVRPFDLTSGALLRACLVRLGGGRHALLACMHHIASDGWSAGVLTREVGRLYQAFLAGEPSPLTALPVQYADFAVWQRRWLEGEELERQLSYWRRTLEGAPVALELPSGRSRPAVQTFRGGEQPLRLDADLSARLVALAQAHKATPFMLCLAAFKALLYRYTGQRDIVVGAPVGGRARPELEGLIGFFLNNLVLRTRLDGGLGFDQLLQRVRETTLEAYAHQDLPFERLLDELRPPRDLSRTPIFQVVFNWLEFARRQAVPLADVTLEPLTNASPMAKFDLEVYGWQTQGRIAMTVVYNRDLFGDQQIATLARHLEEILRAVAEAPRQPLSRLPLTAPGQAVATRAPEPRLQGSVPEIFQRVATAYAERPAVCGAETTWTYGELRVAARRVAHALLTTAGDGTRPVALVFPPGGAQLAAVLGVLEAGKAYLPLDPGYPRQRLLDMVADAAAGVVLAAAGQLDTARDLTGADRGGDDLSLLDFDNLPEVPASWQAPPVAPSALAYLLYTSGSVGRPKGVMQSQRNLVHHIDTYARRLGLGAEDRLTLLPTYSFDAAVMDIYGALLTGASLWPWDVLQRGLDGLAAWMQRHRITVYHSTPTVFRAFLQALRQAPVDLPDLRLVVLGGEEVRREDLELFERLLGGGCRLINGLGPTESTLALQWFLEPGAALPMRHSVPVGRPVEGLEVLLWHAAGRQVAPWGTGEIVLRGRHLAHGYWRRPRHTAAAFAPDPEGGEGRVYLSGDLGRLLPGGEIEFAGRTDHQVKIRGFRVEPGEVEARLEQHPGVAEVVVLAAEQAAGDRRLVAYARLHAADLDSSELRAFVARRLPEYMVPAAFVLLDVFPLTPTGKVDRRALPVPTWQAETDFVAPRTPLEETLASMWRELLARERVGVEDDFFELGGQSLLATQLMSRLRRDIDVEVPLRRFFEAPTVAGLASAVNAEQRRTAAEPRRPALEPVSRLRPLPLSFGQERLWFLDQLQPGEAVYNLPVALRLRGDLRLAALYRSLDELVSRHEILRTTFVAVAGSPRQMPAATHRWPLPLVDLLALGGGSEAHSEALARRDARRSFDLAAGPVFRACLVRLAASGPASDHVLLVNMHHIVSDAWSAGLLVDELSTLYRAFAARQRSPLSPLRLQYADFAAWQRGWLQGAELARQLQVWRQRLAGAPARLELPTDRPRPALQNTAGAIAWRHVESTPARVLNAQLGASGATPFMVLLAAFGALLARMSGQQDLVVGSPIANRNAAETENLIGFFVNTLALRLDLRGRPSFEHLLERVRRITLDAYDHQDLPFERLVDALEIERSLDRTPLFQVVLVLQNAPAGTLELPGLTLEALPTGTGRVKFDLQLTVVERPAGGLRLALEYRTDLFDATTAQRLLSHFDTLLASALERPAQELGQLPLLAPAQRHQLLLERSLGPGTVAQPEAADLYGRFLRQVRRVPDAVALSGGRRQFSYASLAAAAARLGKRLRRYGVGPEVRVGLCLERTPELLEALLAVLYAGGVYVPVDPSYPAARRSFLMRDCGMRVLLTQGHLRDGLDVPEGITVMEVEAGAATPAAPGAVPTGGSPPRDGRQLLYIIYTSGSTGQPKGVGIGDAQVCALLDACQPRFAFGRDDVWSLFHSYAFDFSVWEIWGALAFGGRLVLVPYWVSRVPARVHGLLAEQGVTVLNQTPSAFLQLITADAESAVPLQRLRWVVFGGEALEPRSLRGWVRRYGTRQPRLINMYGITETTVHVTYRRLSRATLTAAASVIGGALEHLQLYVVDRWQQPAPLGVAGELQVGGAGLARGYLGRPSLTAQRFVPADLPALPPGGRLYRSGDLARHLATGDVEYLGRVDHQVQVRGFRIELGEIEAVLTEHPQVERALVLLREDSGVRRLVAYVLGPQGQQAEAPGPQELRAFLLSQLPEHMVPAAFVRLDALPLTAHGKVDRAALPLPDTAQLRSEVAYEPPATEAEEDVAEVWAQVLGLERVGAEDNFFTLGGDSILSIQVLDALRQRGWQAQLQLLFQHQTVRALGSHLQATAEESTEAEPPRAEPFSLLADDERSRLRQQADIEDAYPLSRLQSGMLFHSEMDPASPVYHDVFSAHLRAPFGLAALRATLDWLSARHPLLRTSFHLSGFREPLQWVHRRAGLPFEVCDLRRLSPEDQEVAVQTWVDGEKRRAFDWRQPPLLRLALHLRGSGSFQLSVGFHHAILDGWSLSVLLTELIRDYLQRCRGETSEATPAPPPAFRHFIALERASLESEDSRAYWAQQLDGLEVIGLPRWYAAGEVRSDRGRKGVRRQPLPLDLSRRLVDLSRDAGLPLKSLLLAVHLRVLGTLSGRGRVVTGLISNGRPEETGVENSLGLYLNTLPLVLELPGGSWLDLLRATFEAERELLPHRRLPLAELQRRSGQQPLFDVVFNYVHFHVYRGLADNREIELVGGELFEQTNFDLVFNVNRDPVSNGLMLRLEYDRGEFGAAQVEDLLAGYRRLFEALIADPSAAFDAASWLTPGARHQLLREWNDTAIPCPQQPLVHELFFEHARLRPAALAVTDGRRFLTYGELARRARLWAGRLRGLGVGPDVRVVLCTERELLERLTATVAVLAAGGAYVALDPAYPEERLRFQIEDCQAPVLLTQRRFLPRLPDTGATVLCLDAPSDDFPNELVAAPKYLDEGGARPDPANLAYVVYTSGSTGKPKGVETPHAGLMNLVRWHQRYYHVRPCDRGTQVASPAFDASVWELWPYLAAGASLHIPDEATRLSSAGMIRWWAQQGITLAYLMAPLAEGVMEEPVAMAPRLAVRALIIGGDRVHRGPDPAAPYLAMNHYGPAEYSVTCTAGIVPPAQPGHGLPSVGRVLDNTEIHLFDGRLEPVPIGVFGELYVGGIGLARGYQRRPARTAGAFVPHPCGEPGVRLYRTGDLVRYLPDGELDFLGRRDHQVKLHGRRIELGEIESVLCQHPAVRDAAVLVRGGDQDGGGPRLLAAYLVPRQGQEAAVRDSAALLGALAERLPDFMLPSALLHLESLPLTSNGKVDRRALLGMPLPDAQTGEYVVPRTPVEQLLAGLWSEVLNQTRISADADFFALGGHSLAAMQLAAKVRDAFGVEVTVRALFEAPTVARLSVLIEQQLSAGARDARPPLQAEPRDQPLPLSFGQQRLWFLHQLDEASSAYNIPTTVRLSGDLDARALAAAVGDLTRRHEVLRTTFRGAAGGPRQVISAPRPAAPPRLDLSGLAPDQRLSHLQHLVAVHAGLPFDLSTGPLLRLLLVRLERRDHALLTVQHHTVTDGWSVGILIRELGYFYSARLEGRAPDLPSLPVQYADFAVWQRRWLSGETLTAQIDYWRRRLAGATFSELPSDRPRPAVLTSRAGQVRGTLPAELGTALQEMARAQGATLFMVLLSGLQALMGRTSGQRDIAVGTPVAGRNHRYLDGLVGLFLNNLVLRADLGAGLGLSFKDLLAQARERTLEAYIHQDVPFEQLVAQLHPQRDLSRTPFFQVLLTLQNVPLEVLELPRLQISLLAAEFSTAQYDLALSITERDDGSLDWSALFNTDLFDPSSQWRLVGHLRTLLQAAAASPDMPLAALPLATVGERHQLVHEWPGGSVGEPPAPLLDGLIEVHAEARPDAVAVVHGQRHLSYGGLWRRAGRLARYLAALGARPEVRVGLCLERGPDMLVALLGVLRAGAAYVPLDPAYPPQRLAFLLDDALASGTGGAPLLVTSREIARRFREVSELAAEQAPVLPPATSLLVLEELALDDSAHDETAHDETADKPWADDRANLPELAQLPRPEIDHPAYVIYTSGSSGQPKGVVVPHRGIVRSTQARFDLYPAPPSRFLLLPSFSFDSSVATVFWTLGSGGTLVLVAELAARDPETLVRVVAARQVSHWLGVPSLYALLLRRATSHQLASLDTVIVAGEACTGELVMRHRAQLEAGLYNEYGPTEGCIWCTAWRDPARGEVRQVPIGSPIPGARVRVLDRRSAPVPALVPGELVLAEAAPGSGLARGYLRRPARTATTFVPDAYAAAEGARAYRTGDLVRWRPWGELEFLGRIDHQVKLRGYRIELEEVEAVLATAPGVAAVAAAVREVGEVAPVPVLVAYVVVDAAASAPNSEGSRPEARPAEWRDYLRQRLPAHMLPARFVVLDALPLNANGKIDRPALPVPASPAETGSGAAAGGAVMTSTVERRIAAVWRQVLGAERIGPHDNFFDLGGHSLLLVELQEQLQGVLGQPVALVDLFRNPTVRTLATFLGAPDASSGNSAWPSPAVRSRRPVTGDRVEIAVVGLAHRLPGAGADTEALWQLLRDGVETISFFELDELRRLGRDEALLERSEYVPARAQLDGIENFDAAFFGFTPREAEVMDPQQRVALEVAWEALENTGYDARRYPGAIGVFCGAGSNTYLWNQLVTRPDILQSVGTFQGSIASEKDHLATQISYKLGLRGPSLAVQTACSTSLVAVSLACQSLLSGQSDMALAGGITLRVPSRNGYLYEEGGILSPDGHCRAFDADSLGTVGGDGAGMVVLKRLADARADGDSVRAVIRGFALNNDGAHKVGYTAPSVEGQAAVIRDAHLQAGVDARSITYVEAHGTGTPLGDPIEVAALRQAFQAAGVEDQGFCGLGTIKSNMGHLDTAAGVAGLIKTVLALQHRELPPTLHFQRANPRLQLDGSPFYVNDRLRPWEPAPGHPRRAGVSSFGIGGTNAHVIVEEAPEEAASPASPASPAAGLWLLSARSRPALTRAAEALADHLQAHPELPPADIAWTLQAGRRVFPWRLALRAEDRAAGIEVLRHPEDGGAWTNHDETEGRPVVFLFPGQGAQYPGMIGQTYIAEPVFRRWLDRCIEGLQPHLQVDLLPLLLDPAAADAERLRRTELAQPALFAVEYALARLWMEWGVEPVAMLGHSVGEYVAACLADVLSLEDALHLMALRGRLMQQAEPGSMLVVALPEAEVNECLQAGEELVLAAVNAPDLCVVAGPVAAVAALGERLQAEGVETRLLRTSHAFHSPSMAPACKPLSEVLSRVELRPPRRRYLSNLSGTWIRDDEATDPDYWMRHLLSAVRFADSLQELQRELPDALWLEVGPGRGLSTLARRQIPADAGAVIVDCWPHPKDAGSDAEHLAGALARAWLAGAEVDWARVHGGSAGRRRVPLPAYPFERRRFWVERPATSWRGGGAPLLLVAADAEELNAMRERLRAEGETVRVISGSEQLEELLRQRRPVAEPLPEAAELQPENVGDPTGGPTEPAGRPSLATTYVAPRNETEVRLAEVWAELLGIGGVGVRDDLFELGGHSLLATRIAARVREDFGVDLSVDELFAQPTVEGLAKSLAVAHGSNGNTASERQAIRVQPRDADGLPLSLSQERLWFLYRLEPGNPAYHLSLQMRLRGELEIDALERAFRQLVQRHEALRTRFEQRGAEARQVIEPQPRVALPLVDLGGLTEQPRIAELDRVRRRAAELAFDLGRDLPVRFVVLRLGPADHALVMIQHHIISDLWSVRTVLGDLTRIYNALRAGQDPGLSPLPVQFADFAVWQRRRLEAGELDEQMAYWRRQLAGLGEPLRLPTDGPEPDKPGPAGSEEPVLVPAPETGTLRRLAQAAQGTLFMVLQAAYAVILHLYSEQEDIVIGSPIAGRERRELENLVGFFVNTLVLRHDLSGDPSFRELLERVRRTTLDAYQHQEVPLQHLSVALQPDRQGAPLALFRVWLVLQNSPQERMDLSGLQLEGLSQSGSAVRHDLHLGLTEGPAGLAGQLQYRRGLIARETAAEMVQLLQRTLEIVGEQPEIRLRTLVAQLRETGRRGRQDAHQGMRSANLDRLRRRRRPRVSD